MVAVVRTALVGWVVVGLVTMTVIVAGCELLVRISSAALQRHRPTPLKALIHWQVESHLSNLTHDLKMNAP